MRKPLQTGDRVAVYGPLSPFGGGTVMMLDGDRGTVSRIRKCGTPVVQLDRPPFSELDCEEFDLVEVHPKQCRRLVRRKPKRVWVNWYRGEDGEEWGFASPSQEKADQDADPTRTWCREFVEVRRKR